MQRLDRHGLRTVQPAWPSCRVHLRPSLCGGAPPEQPLPCRPVPTVDPRYGTGRSWFDAIAQRRLAQLPGIMRQDPFASIAWEQPDAERRLQQTDLLSDGRGIMPSSVAAAPTEPCGAPVSKHSMVLILTSRLMHGHSAKLPRLSGRYQDSRTITFR